MHRLIPVVLLLPLSVLADDAKPTVPTTWAGTAAGGYIRTAGTTNTTSANLKAELDYTNLPWTNELTGSLAAGNT